MLTKYLILVLTFIVDFNIKQRVDRGLDWRGGGALNQRAVPCCDVMSVLSKTCSDISASCFVTSLEHFKHYRKRKERKNKAKIKKTMIIEFRKLTLHIILCFFYFCIVFLLNTTLTGNHN